MAAGTQRKVLGKHRETLVSRYNHAPAPRAVLTPPACTFRASCALPEVWGDVRSRTLLVGRPNGAPASAGDAHAARRATPDVLQTSRMVEAYREKLCPVPMQRTGDNIDDQPRLNVMQSQNATRTLAFLFTDIEGSTGLWDRFPDLMKSSLERHDAIVHR